MKSGNKYNPEGSQLRKAQLRMLDMLSYSRDNNIPYWLDSGTLLGARSMVGSSLWDDESIRMSSSC